MIAARLMKKNHFMVMTTYTGIVLFVSSTIFVTISSTMDFGFLTEFSWASWGLVLLAAILTILENVSKFLAFKYQEASKLQKLAFLPNVWAFTVDLLVIHSHFSTMQIWGFTILFIFYFSEACRFFVCKP